MNDHNQDTSSKSKPTPPTLSLDRQSDEVRDTSISIKNEEIKDLDLNGLGKSDDIHFSNMTLIFARLFIFMICAGMIIFGRHNVPENVIQCIEDKIILSLQFANDFINRAGNELYRNAFQILCSFCVDVVFCVSFGYWILYGKNTRFPLTLGIFYGVRALIQIVWESPYPDGFYWLYPGIPSIAVHYGHGSDFFFSGHAGFMMICAAEWHRIGKPKVRNCVIIAGIYTVIILLVYRIHYSIDIFTGIIFGEWCWMKCDMYTEQLNQLLVYIYKKMTNLVGKGHWGRTKPDEVRIIPEGQENHVNA